MKITIVGDIMCEPPILKAAKKSDGTYDFSPMYEKVKPLFSESDYVIGNMETTLAGEEAGYTETFFSFNAPDSFGEAMKDAGFDLVTTINNHTLDRGAEGIIRTMEVLDKIGLPYTGTTMPFCLCYLSKTVLFGLWLVLTLKMDVFLWAMTARSSP